MTPEERANNIILPGFGLAVDYHIRACQQAQAEIIAAITAAEEAERERIAKALDEYGDRATARAIRERREGKQ